jgi:hypothetical protein
MPLSDDQIDQVIETLETATEENNVSSARAGQVVNLPAEGEVWVTGDLHDHRRNFEKLVVAADLANNPQRHVVLHEMIHGEHFDENRAEDSWQMLFWAADLKCAFSSQVHFLFANHDLAQIHGEGIMKAGLSVCEAFNAGVKRDFGSRRAAAHVAVTEMLLSFPLAIRTASGLFISHSIPTDEQIPKFDYTVFDRSLTGEDYRRRTGAVYQLVWGRKMSPQSANAFADRVGAKILITGHQPQESGFAVNGDRQIILASDHNQGVFLPLSLSETYEMNGIVERVRKFVSLTLPEAPPDVDSTDPTEPAPQNLNSAEAAPEPAQPELAQVTTEHAEASMPEQPAVAVEPAVLLANVVEECPKPLTAESLGASSGGPPPNERQRQGLCEMIAAAFVEIRLLGWDGKAAQAADLADAFHNVPREMYGLGTWSRSLFRAGLEGYQQKYHVPGQSSHRNYATWFDRIMDS